MRVKWLAEFDPLPDRLLELFVPRKLHPETKQRMKFFEVSTYCCDQFAVSRLGRHTIRGLCLVTLGLNEVF